MNLAWPSFNLNPKLVHSPEKKVIENTFDSLVKEALLSNGLANCNVINTPFYLFGKLGDSVGSSVLLAFQVTECGQLEPILADYQEWGRAGMPVMFYFYTRVQ